MPLTDKQRACLRDNLAMILPTLRSHVIHGIIGKLDVAAKNEKTDLPRRLAKLQEAAALLAGYEGEEITEP